VHWFKANPSTDFVHNKAEYALSQDLDKSSIPEPLKGTLLFSPLGKDKLFGLPLGKLQEEVSKTP
jgi:hypothetical protein